MIARGLDIDHDWFTCALDDVEKIKYFELCRINSTHVWDSQKNYHHIYEIITYYDGKVVFTGSLKECRQWITTHYVDRRYLDCYGKRN